jgi:putative ABC transport system permease protein
MNQWLNQFAFHTTIQLFSFVQAALYSAAIAFLTISIQVVRLAVKTPLQSLRYE